MNKNLQAVILAGGKGTRLGNLGKKVPKAMVDILGIPFVELLINQLKKKGIKNFLILTGYKKKFIISYFNKKKNIKIHSGNVNWQTLTRLIKAKPLINNLFLLMYCDNYLLNYNLKKQIQLIKKKKSKIVLSIVKKKTGQKGTVIFNNSKVHYKKGISTNYTEAGYILINKFFFFNGIKKINKRNKMLSNYLNFLSKRGDLFGMNYGNKYLCVENKKLLQKTRIYFKNKFK